MISAKNEPNRFWLRAPIHTHTHTHTHICSDWLFCFTSLHFKHLREDSRPNKSIASVNSLLNYIWNTFIEPVLMRWQFYISSALLYSETRVFWVHCACFVFVLFLFFFLMQTWFKSIVARFSYNVIIYSFISHLCGYCACAYQFIWTFKKANL